MFIGRLITAATSKFGVISRKAAVRLATDAGKGLADKAKLLGRGLNVKEVQEVFEQTLPKRLRPKLLATREECLPYLKKMGMSEEQAQAYIKMPTLQGCCLPNGTSRHPIFIGDFLSMEHQVPIIAHELEHALESNCRLNGIIGRKFSKFFKAIFKQNTTDYNLASYNLQYGLTERFNPSGAYIRTFQTEPTRKGILKGNGLSESRYLASMRDFLRTFVNGKYKQKNNGFKNLLFNEVLDGEIPAYTVGGRVQRYLMGLNQNQMAYQEGVSLVYQDAKSLLSKDCWLYLKDKLLGRLKTPHPKTPTLQPATVSPKTQGLNITKASKKTTNFSFD